MLHVNVTHTCTSINFENGLRQTAVAFCLSCNNNLYTKCISDHFKAVGILSIAREWSKKAAAITEKAERAPYRKQSRGEGHSLSSGHTLTDNNKLMRYYLKVTGCVALSKLSPGSFPAWKQTSTTSSQLQP